jgi:hypothetical protein
VGTAGFNHRNATKPLEISFEITICTRSMPLSTRTRCGAPTTGTLLLSDRPVLQAFNVLWWLTLDTSVVPLNTTLHQAVLELP